MLSDTLIARIKQKYANRPVQYGTPPEPVVTFPAIHPQVGDIEIFDDQEELTVYIGHFTHWHVADYTNGIQGPSPNKLADTIIEFLEELFADKIVLWGMHKGSGGWFHRDQATSGHAQGPYFVWSGPVENNLEQWSFADAPNTAVFTTWPVLLRNTWIGHVSHDTEDGAWQFHGPQSPSVQNAAVVSLAEMLKLDPTLVELADLPLGWQADRQGPEMPWIRSSNQPSGK